jgi:hypothetical protein
VARGRVSGALGAGRRVYFTKNVSGAHQSAIPAFVSARAEKSTATPEGSPVTSVFAPIVAVTDFHVLPPSTL